MMDLLSAFSLASSIVQFVDFTAELVQGGREIYGSGDTAGNKTLETVTDEMRKLSSNLSIQRWLRVEQRPYKTRLC